MTKAKKGFTLAEVLITLVIIGIIAAVTIPTILQNKEKQETISKLKKVYSTLSNAFALSTLYNGDYSTWGITSAAWSNGQIEFEEYLMPYLKLNKYCGVSKYTTNSCFPYTPKGKDGSTTTSNGDPATFFILSDGTNVRFHRWNYNQTTAPTSYYFWIDFDINGHKGHNRYGYDIFTIMVSPQKGLVPDWYYETRESLLARCNGNVAVSNRETGCLPLIIKDGWQIKDDYSW